MPKSKRTTRKKAVQKTTQRTTQKTVQKSAQKMPAECPHADRTYKARLFAMIFSEKENLLELYNAVNGTHYEHQSTSNPNLPLRFLFYIADLYSGMLRGADLYGRKRMPLDTPHFLIFYNGQEEMPEQMTLRLSDSFKIAEETPQLELTATMWNITIGNNRRLMEASRTLRDYAEYTSRVRKHARKMPLEKAVECAVDECIREGVLADFLRKNRAEAIKMSIYEYDEEDHKRILREEGREEGWSEGRKAGRMEGKIEGKAEDVLELLDELGAVSVGLRERIMRERDLDVLRRLHRLAARAENLEEFVRLSGKSDQK